MIAEAVKTILLVEDDGIIAMEETMVLREHGYNVIEASSGEEAVSRALSDDSIDLVLMDINLDPGMDGTKAAELILAKRDIPLVFLSSHTEKEVVQKTEGITSYGYIVKNSGEMVMLTSINMAFKLFSAKTEARQATKSFEDAFNSINDPVFLMDLNYKVLNCNNAFSKFVGREKSEIIGKECRCLVHGTDDSPADCPCVRMRISGVREKMDMMLNGRYYEVVVDPLFNENGDVVRILHIILDVTEHKQAEKLLEDRIMQLISPDVQEVELTFEDLFDIGGIQHLQDVFSAATGLASLITKPDGTPITSPSNFTPFCSAIVRSTKDGLANCMKSDSEIVADSGKGASIQQCKSSGLWDAGARIMVNGRHIANWCTGQVRDSSMTEDMAADYARSIGADVDEAVKAFRKVPVVEKEKLEQYVVLMKTIVDFISRDALQNLRQARMLSELQKDEQKIKSLLNEKDSLLKEVYGRIRSYISAAESLLNTQTESLSDSDAAEVLKSSVQRIYTSRVLYEKLLAAERYEALPVKDFIAEILESVSSVFPKKASVMDEFDIDDLQMNSTDLISMGLIINELLINIFKHAYRAGDELRVKLSCKDEDGNIVMKVEDNGPGYPPGFIPNESGRFGLKLVDKLSKQLKAEFVMENKNGTASGTVCRLIIPAGEHTGL